jgi:hypothetical protein
MIAKKSDFVEILQGLFTVKDVKGKAFSLTVSKNIKLIQESIKDLEGQGSPSIEFAEFAAKVRAIGDDTNDSERAEKIKALEEENIDLVNERKAQINEIKEKLTEEVELDLITLTENDLPEDITTEQVMALEKIIT